MQNMVFVFRCPIPSKCIDTPGSYYCVCDPGWEKVSKFQCVDINECSRGIHGCDPRSSCVNSPGSWKCICNKGWYPYPEDARLPTCKDINECVDVPNSCSSNAYCVNTFGSYACHCHRCYYMSGNQCKPKCRRESQYYYVYVVTYYTQYYSTSCGFLGLKRCRKSRRKQTNKKVRRERKVWVPNYGGAKCPCS